MHVCQKPLIIINDSGIYIYYIYTPKALTQVRITTRTYKNIHDTFTYIVIIRVFYTRIQLTVNILEQ